jgi:hypothetical protein
MPTDYRKLYNKDFVGAWDLPDRDLTVTIERVEAGNLMGPGGRKSRRPVIYMKAAAKGFVVNPTNGKTIATMYGKMIEGWVGKRITLFKSMTRDPNGGEEQVECIRVRPQVPSSRPVTEAGMAAATVLGDLSTGMPESSRTSAEAEKSYAEAFGDDKGVGETE